MRDKLFRLKLNRIKKRGERWKQEKELRDIYADYIPEHKKRKISNIMLVVSVVAIICYVLADYILQYKTGYELSPTITPYYFAFWTGEIFLLAGIKVGKVIKGPSGTDVYEETGRTI